MTPNEIKTAAAVAGIPLNKLLLEAGVNRTTWWRWQSGRYAPRLATIDKIKAGLSAAQPAAATAGSKARLATEFARLVALVAKIESAIQSAGDKSAAHLEEIRQGAARACAALEEINF